MDPKLIRMYSDILNEQGFAQQYALRNTEDPRIAAARQQATASAPAPGTAAAVRGGRGGTGPVSAPQAAKPTAPLPGNPNAPAYTKDPGQTKKVGTGASGFPVAGQGGRPTPTKPPAPAIDPRVASARAADAARQAAAPAPGTTQDPSGGQGNRAFLPGAAGGAKPETPAAQTTPDQMRTTSAVGASNIGFTGPETPATAAAPAPAPVTGQSSYTSQTGAELGKTGAGSSGYTDTAGLSGIDSGGQAARPTTTGPAVTSSSGETVKTGSGGTLTSRDFNQPQFGSLGNRLNEFELEEELEEEVEESIDQELEEAFNEMLRLSGIQLNEKAPPGAKAERMVKHIKKGYAKDGKLSDKEKSIAFATAWKAKKAGKLDEGFRVMMDEEGHTLEHIVNRFKHEAKTFLNTGEMSDKLYDALYDYYLDRGEMPYGIAKAREGDPYTWVAARFEADIDGTVDVKMPLGEVGGDDTLNELARLAGLSESRVDECGDMGMDTEDRLNVSTNMSSDGTKSVNISAQGEKAEELLSMLKLAGMGGSDRPAMVMIDRDEEMMDEDRPIEYPNTPNEEYQTVASITRQGNDLNREKKQFANMPKAGDNPMATDYMLDEELSALLDSVLVKEADPQRPKGDTGEAEIWTAGKGPPPSPDEGPVGKAAAPKAPAPSAPKAPVIVPGTKR